MQLTSKNIKNVPNTNLKRLHISANFVLLIVRIGNEAYFL